MPDPITRVTLFVPGAPESTDAWASALRGRGVALESGTLRCEGTDETIEVEWIANDGSFGAAFFPGTLDPAAVRAVDAAPGALLLHCPMDLLRGREQLVALVERLRDAGAIAVRLEQSKLGAEVSRWLELFSAADPWSWHRGGVLFLTGADALQSCGMHAFSLPDVRIERSEGEDVAALQQFASSLNAYQLGEDPLLLSGQTFAPDPETPRRVLERWPDTGYPPDEPCHNPYGVWRLGPAGGKARPTGELVPVFMPSLWVMLQVLEEQAGRPLTQAEVESHRDQAPCLMMEARHAQELERTRGCADLEPALIWEQWQLVREDRA